MKTINSSALSDTIACQNCGVLHRYHALKSGHKAYCIRCGSTLYTGAEHQIEQGLALILAALVLFVISNAYPMIILTSQGLTQALTLLTAVTAYWDRGMHILSVLMALNIFILPIMELLSLAWILLTVKYGWPPGIAIHLYRWQHEIKPWGMLEVFMLGTLVAATKLGSWIDLIYATAFWAYAALIVVIAILHAILSPLLLWRGLEAIRQARSGI